MQSRRRRAAGQGNQHGDATSGDGCGPVAVPEEDHALAELEDQDEDVRFAAESLDRRRHDLKLREQLAAEGFEGVGWNRFVEELARYGHAVMLAFLGTGVIFALCKNKGRPIGTSPPSWSSEEKFDLATDAVVAGIKLFRTEALAGGLWTVEGGASLKTFFIGACVLAFPTVYRSWRSQREAEMHCLGVGGSEDLDGLGQPLTQRIVDPAETCVRWAAIDDGLQALPDDRTRLAVAAHGLGYSYVEIAELLSENADEVSPGNVAQILLRHRRRVERGQSA